MIILVTGATGFLGKNIVEKLRSVEAEVSPTSLSMGVDLRSREATFDLFSDLRPDFVLNCAAFVGGIQYGYDVPASLFSDNMSMTINLFEACREFQVSKLVNPISNCAYPAKAKIFREDEFWEGALHESVLAYGFVRRASWVAGWSYAKQYQVDALSLVLSNMYGPGDHFEEARSHALGALVKKFVDAKRTGASTVNVWGTGAPVREWLHVYDGAEAMIRGLQAKATSDLINVGTATGVSIRDLAGRIKDIVSYEGDVVFDRSKPDGAAWKTVDGVRGKEHLGWQPEISLEHGLRDTIEWYISNTQE